MKKRIISLFLSMLLAMSMVMPVFAEGDDFIVDDYDVLSDSEEEQLQEIAERIWDNLGVQVLFAIVTDTRGMDNEAFAEAVSVEYYEDKVVLLENKETGTVFMQSYGKAVDVITTDVCGEMLNLYNEPTTYFEGVKVCFEELEEKLAEAGFAAAVPGEEPEVVELEEVEAEEAETEVVAPAPEEEVIMLDLPRLVDEADVLTDEEEAEVLAALDEVSERQQFDVVIATVNDYEQADVENAAMDYYDYNGFGFGEENDGIILYLSMGDRELHLTGTGFGIQAFTDFGREKLIEEIKPEMGEDDFYAAFMEYVTLCDDYITQAKSGDPYDIHNLTEEESMRDKCIKAGVIFAFLLLVSCAVSKIVTERAVKKHLSVQQAAHAREYVRAGSFKVPHRRDIFMHSSITKRYNPKDDDDHGGRSGGSTITRGSSGVSHSGTSSKF